MIGRSIPAFVVADALNACIAAAVEAEEVRTLRKLIEVAEDMSLLTVDERDAGGDAVSVTWRAA